MIKINNKKLESLREHYNTGGTVDPEEVTELFGFANTAELDAHIERLRSKYPDEFPPIEDEPYTYFLKGDGNLLQEMEMVKNKNNVLIFAVKEPKEPVKLIIKGKPLEVDLVKLRKLGPNALAHGLPAAQLIELAELAQP